MKVLFIILGILALLTYGGLSAGLGIKNSKQIKEFEKVEALGLGGFTEMAGVPSKSSYSTAMLLNFVGILIFLFGMVALFLKSNGVGMAAAGLTALTGILMWVLQPDYGSRSENGKPIALIVMVAALIAALSIFMVQNANKKKAANG